MDLHEQVAFAGSSLARDCSIDSTRLRTDSQCLEVCYHAAVKLDVPPNTTRCFTDVVEESDFTSRELYDTSNHHIVSLKIYRILYLRLFETKLVMCCNSLYPMLATISIDKCD